MSLFCPEFLETECTEEERNWILVTSQHPCPPQSPTDHSNEKELGGETAHPRPALSLVAEEVSSPPLRTSSTQNRSIDVMRQPCIQSWPVSLTRIRVGLRMILCLHSQQPSPSA